MDRLETEITHMLRMLEPPFFEGWRREIWRKAKRLESTDVDFAGLKDRLESEVKALGWGKPPAASDESTSPDPCPDFPT